MEAYLNFKLQESKDRAEQARVERDENLYHYFLGKIEAFEQALYEYVTKYK